MVNFLLFCKWLINNYLLFLLIIFVKYLCEKLA